MGLYRKLKRSENIMDIADLKHQQKGKEPAYIGQLYDKL